MAGFDTLTSIVAYAPDEASFQRTSREIFDRLQAYSDLFNIYEDIPEDSPLKRYYSQMNGGDSDLEIPAVAAGEMLNMRSVNALAGEKRVSVHPQILRLLQLGMSMEKETEGRFNPALGALLKLWHDARETALADPREAYLPEPAALQEAAKHSDPRKLELDAAASAVHFTDSRMQLDAGGLGKGFAVEQVAREMLAAGVDHYLISAGGNVKAIGTKPGDVPWQVGIRDPRPEPETESNALQSVAITTQSVVTSGVYERNFSYQGKSYHHIIDPATLYPSQGYLSISIVAEDSGLADCYSTSLFNYSFEAGKIFAEAHHIAVLWILDDGTVYRNEAYKALSPKPVT